MLLVCREHPVFDEERKIAESITNRWIVVHKKRRNIKDDFHFLQRNQFQPFAAIVVVGGDTLTISLPELIVAILLFKTRRGRCQRRNPVRLFVLSFVHSGKPVGKISILGKRYR